MRKKVATLAFCLLKGCNCITVIRFEHQFRRTVYFWTPGRKALTCLSLTQKRSWLGINPMIQTQNVTRSVFSRISADTHCLSVANTPSIWGLLFTHNLHAEYSLNSTLFLYRFYSSLYLTILFKNHENKPCQYIQRHLKVIKVT